jgi:hypothetical protein
MMRMLIEPSTWAAHFPMIRAGGLFILIMGLAVVLGAILHKARRLFLILGGIAATVVIVLTAAPLSAPLGKPTSLQFYFLFGSIALEIVLIRLAVARYRATGERSLLLAILFVVGLHFLPMAGAFGPMCLVLGAILCLSSGIGLWVNQTIPMNVFWAMDGILKIVFGSLMFLMF